MICSKIEGLMASVGRTKDCDKGAIVSRSGRKRQKNKDNRQRYEVCDVVYDMIG